MLKNISLVSAVMATMTCSALAADLPLRAAPPVYYPPATRYVWTGFYLGLNAGYAFNGRNTYALTANDAVAVTGLANGFVQTGLPTNSSGFAGGGQIGYNYQIPAFAGGGVVVGIEADADYTALKSNVDLIGNTVDTSFHSRTEYVGTLRARIGYAFDNLLIYGTGGLAYGGVSNGVAISNVGGNTFYSGSRDTIRTGYAYGGGIEYAIPTTSLLNVFHSGGVTIKAELIRYDLGSSGGVITRTDGITSSFTSRVHTDGDLVRIGVNYKFNTVVPTPVIARY